MDVYANRSEGAAGEGGSGGGGAIGWAGFNSVVQGLSSDRTTMTLRKCP